VASAKFPGDREALHRLVSGHPYYKLEFLANYPDPDGSATGDVGVKVTRVYFQVSNGNTPVRPRRGSLHRLKWSRRGFPDFLDLRGRIRP
jgi:hypothetical protein